MERDGAESSQTVSSIHPSDEGIHYTDSHLKDDRAVKLKEYGGIIYLYTLFTVHAVFSEQAEDTSVTRYRLDAKVFIT